MAWLIHFSIGNESTALGQAKHPIPKKSETEKALQTLKELYATEYADRSNPGQIRLGRALLVLGSKEKDPTQKYVVLSEALRVSKEANDFETAWKSIGRANFHFKFDETPVRLELLKAAAKKIESPGDADAMALLASAFTKRLVNLDKYVDATKTVDALSVLAKKTKNKNLIKRLNDSKTEIKRIAERYTELTSSLKTLQSDPTNGTANHAIGMFYFFQKGQFVRGMPYLSESDKPQFKKVALAELNTKSSPEQWLEVADQWWKIGADETLAKAKIHAIQIYLEILPALSGLTRKKIESRISEHDPTALELEQIAQQKWTVRWNNNLSPWNGLRFTKTGQVSFTAKKVTTQSRYETSTGAIRMNGPSGPFHYIFSMRGKTLRVVKYDSNNSSVLATGIGTPKK